LCIAYASASAQQQAATPKPDQPPAVQRPSESDNTSRQLISNYLNVTGGPKAHQKIHNIQASGTFKESHYIKNFELIENNKGQRHLIFTWKHLGRHYKEVFSFDGTETWHQKLLPKEQPPAPYSGTKAKHFAHQRWLIHPFTLPLNAEYVFNYQGVSKVGGRPAHVVVGYGAKNERSYFYFDQEKFLLTRYGGKGQLGQSKIDIDYQATRFKAVNGVLMPAQLQQVAQGQAFGEIKFEEIMVNREIDEEMFKRPTRNIPVLRQKTK
jgi:hypothetical protein